MFLWRHPRSEQHPAVTAERAAVRRRLDRSFGQPLAIAVADTLDAWRRHRRAGGDRIGRARSLDIATALERRSACRRRRAWCAAIPTRPGGGAALSAGVHRRRARTFLPRETPSPCRARTKAGGPPPRPSIRPEVQQVCAGFSASTSIRWSASCVGSRRRLRRRKTMPPGSPAAAGGPRSIGRPVMRLPREVDFLHGSTWAAYGELHDRGRSMRAGARRRPGRRCRLEPRHDDARRHRARADFVDNATTGCPTCAPGVALCLPHQPAIQHRFPRFPADAGHDRDGGCDRPHRLPSRPRCRRDPAGQTLPPGLRRDALRPEGRGESPGPWAGLVSARRPRASAGRDSTFFNRTSPVLKRSSACSLKFGISFNLPHLNRPAPGAQVYTDGSICLNHGGTEMGQGCTLHPRSRRWHEVFQVDVDRIRPSGDLDGRGAQLPRRRRLDRAPTSAGWRPGDAANTQAAHGRLRRRALRHDAGSRSPSRTITCASPGRAATRSWPSAGWRGLCWLGRVSLSATGLTTTTQDPLGSGGDARPAVLLTFVRRRGRGGDRHLTGESQCAARRPGAGLRRVAQSGDHAASRGRLHCRARAG